MIGVPSVVAAIPRDFTGPRRNGNFADGLDGWRQAPTSSGAWTVAADGVHPTTAGTDPAGLQSVGLQADPDNLVPTEGDVGSAKLTIVGYAPVAGTIYSCASTANALTDPNPVLVRRSIGTDVAVGPFTLTITMPSTTRAYIGPAFLFTPSVVDSRLPGFYVTSLTMTATHASTDLTCLLDNVSIKHGRDDSSGQPDASSATIDLSFSTAEDPDAPDLLAAMEIGANIEVAVLLAGTTYPRFTGYLTDVAIGWDDAGAATPENVVAQLVAVGPLAALGRTIIGDTPWAQELDGLRARHIFEKAVQKNVGFDFAYEADPGTALVLAKDVDSQPALELLQSVAESAEGVVWEKVNGTVAYADADRRAPTANPALTLDACDLLVSPTWKRDLAGLVNSVSLGWGDPGEGEQNRLQDQDPTSIQQFGLYDYSVGTELATYDDALRIVEDVLARQSTPAWNLTSLPVDVAGLDATRTGQLLALDMHSLIELTGLPETGATPDTARLWVEGWSEQLAAGSHDLELAITDYGRSAGAVTWDTWGTGTWNATPPALQWNNARTPAASA